MSLIYPPFIAKSQKELFKLSHLKNLNYQNSKVFFFPLNSPVVASLWQKDINFKVINSFHLNSVPFASITSEANKNILQIPSINMILFL